METAQKTRRTLEERTADAVFKAESLKRKVAERAITKRSAYVRRLKSAVSTMQNVLADEQWKPEHDGDVLLRDAIALLDTEIARLIEDEAQRTETHG